MKRILVVDDKAENLSILSTLLEAEGYQADLAHDGAEALFKARENPPALVISDLLMPVMDGFSLLRHWKRDERLANIPFVMYTSTYVRSHDECLALDLGADLFLVKPLEHSQLLAQVEETLARADSEPCNRPIDPSAEQIVVLKEYNEALILKLEEQSQALQEANRALEADIAQRRRMEAALGATENKFRLAIEGLRDYAIYLLDLDDRVATWNSGAERTYGYSSFEIIGRERKTFCEAQSDTTITACQMHLECARDKGHFHVKNWHVKKGGSRFWADTSITPLYDASGNLQNYIVVDHALTQSKRFEENLREAEERYRTLISATASVVWNTPASGEFESEQPSWSAFTGQTFDALRGWGWLDAVHPDDRENVARVWAEAVRGRNPYEVEHRLRQIDGRFCEMLVRGVPIRGEDGSIREWIGIHIDNTHRAKAHVDLQASEERYRSLADAMPQIVWVSRPDGFVEFYNRQWYEYTGLSHDETKGEGWNQVIHPLDLPIAWDRWRHSLETGEPYEVQHRCLRHDGEYRWFLARALPQRDEEANILRWFGTSTDIHDFREAQEKLILRDKAIQAVSQGILITDPSLPDNPLVYASHGFEVLTGYDSSEVLGKNCRFLQGPETDTAVANTMRDCIQLGQKCNVEILNYKRDGNTFWNALFLTPVHDETGRLKHFVGVLADVTERRKLEEALQQAQKMDAIGKLAGGVAHDFNNLLTIISGYSELLLMELPAAHGHRPFVINIRSAGERASELTRQLLAFSRQEIIEPVILDINNVIVQTNKMLQRLIGEDITVTSILSPVLPRVKADPGQIDQIIMNLCVNARDAMPTGGQLTIETQALDLEHSGAHGYLNLPDGHYVQLSVSDTGCGMNPEVAAQIFEPFFTTKPKGKGTGLGLAMVFGIAKQNNGHVSVYSELGIGSTFKVLFPAADPVSLESTEMERDRPIRGTETILLVEDNEALRQVARLALETQGYHVLEATNSADAVQKMLEHRDSIQLVLTDVVMPEMGGRELGEALRAQRADLKVLFMSGYTDDAVIRRGIIAKTANFLQKPFTPLGLAKKVRAVLDGPE